jgi:hypothetical protein
LVKPYRVAELRRCVRLLQGADLETRLASAERRPGGGRERLAQQIQLIERMAEVREEASLGESLLRTLRGGRSG